MAASGLIVDLRFKLVSLESTGARHAKVTDAGVSWNYTTVLNIIFLALAVALIVRYFRRGGGLSMLRMMNTPHRDAPSRPHRIADARDFAPAKLAIA